MSALAAFARQRLEDAPDEERRGLLAGLRRAVDARSSHHTEPDAFWREVSAVINELREAGHDLWSHDLDSAGRELWGRNYVDKERPGKLQIQFEFGGSCRTWWRDEASQLGICDDL